MRLADATEEHDRHHWTERPSDWVAGVCDRGVQHDHNEDALALAAAPEQGSFAVLVACDGVSTAPGSDVASLVAATTVCDALDGTGDGSRPSQGDTTAWDRRIVAATQAAVEAIATATEADGGESGRDGAPPPPPPSCTLIAAVVDGPLVVLGWIGDSRAYWLADDGDAVRLTTDDSWAQVMIEAGVPPQEAEHAPNAHAITRWLSADSTDHEPHRAVFQPTGAGWLLVCTDGLWNYASDPEAVAGVLRSAVGDVGPDPVEVAGRLVAWAHAQGGHDNITVGLARL